MATAVDPIRAEPIAFPIVSPPPTQGITIVMVTHSDEIAAYAGRIIRFRDGLIVSDQKVTKPVTAPVEVVVAHAAAVVTP